MRLFVNCGASFARLLFLPVLLDLHHVLATMNESITHPIFFRMKRTDLIFTILLVPLDFLMLVAAGLFAYFLRLTPTMRAIWPVLFEEELPLSRYVVLLLIASVIWIGIFALSGLYRTARRKLPEEMFQVVVSASLGAMTVVLVMFFQHELFNSRFLVIASWALATVFIIAGRIFSRLAKSFLVSKFDWGTHKVLLVGDDKMSEWIMEELEEKRGLGLRVFEHIPAIDMNRIQKAVGNPKVEEVMLSSFDYPKAQIADLINFCHENNLTFRFAPNIFHTITAHTGIDTVGGIPLIEIKRTRLDGWGRVMKREIDLLGALIGIAVLAPCMAAIAILVKLDSPGPVIYKNKRVGPGGQFNMYKFRSMKLEYCTGEEYQYHKEASRFEDEIVKKLSRRRGPVFKVLDDPRRTRIGKILERTSLDELPQLFNVLRGEMSLVGPRPHMPKEVAGYERHHKRVFNVKPGMTGLAQISGRSDLDFDEEVRLDTYYIENWSFALDFIILTKTLFVMLFKRHKQ